AHPFKPVGHRDEDVLTAARLQVGEDLHPKLGAFGLLNPDPENIARSVRQHGQREVHGLAARTTASSRIFTRRASKNTTGYIASSGRACQAVTSASTASVTVLIRSGDTSTAYISPRNAWISRTVNPRAYRAMIC